MTRICICTDSFGVPDPEWGDCWADHLARRFDVVNFSQVSASNLLISRQVDRALLQKPDYMIVNFTSCTRGERRHRGRIEPFSYHTASTETTSFNAQDIKVLQEYFARFFDLEIAIYHNKIIIEHVLDRLVKSGVPFVFDQGGFEHASYAGSGTQYFEQFDQYRSKINLWDFGGNRKFRPYYHITDAATHTMIADYYTRKIQQCVEC